MKLLSVIRFDVLQAERQLEQAKRESHANVASLRSAIRSRLAQPSSLLVMTTLGAVLGVWLARRNKPRVESENISAWGPIVGMVSTYLGRFGMQRLVSAWMSFRSSASRTK